MNPWRQRPGVGTAAASWGKSVQPGMVSRGVAAGIQIQFNYEGAKHRERGRRKPQRARSSSAEPWTAEDEAPCLICEVLVPWYYYPNQDRRAHVCTGPCCRDAAAAGQADGLYRSSTVSSVAPEHSEHTEGDAPAASRGSGSAPPPATLPVAPRQVDRNENLPAPQLVDNVPAIDVRRGGLLVRAPSEGQTQGIDTVLWTPRLPQAARPRLPRAAAPVLVARSKSAGPPPARAAAEGTAAPVLAASREPGDGARDSRHSSQLVPLVREGDRVLADTPTLAEFILEALGLAVPEKPCDSQIRKPRERRRRRCISRALSRCAGQERP